MIFVLLGEESFLVQRALKRLLEERLPADAREFNFDIFDGEEARASAVLERAQTFPVLAPRRMILIRNAQEVRKGELDLFEKSFPKIPETTDLILTASKIDRRLSFWQRVEALGKIRVLRAPPLRELPQWIVEEAGYRISPEAAEGLVSAVGSDLSQIHTTLEKLHLLKGDKEISLADVTSCVLPFAFGSVFELTDAVGRGDLAKALILFRRGSAAGESVIALTALLARHFRILSRIREGENAGIPPFFVKDYQRQAARFSPQELEEKRERIFRADWALKSSPIPSSILFERLLRDLCRGGHASH